MNSQAEKLVISALTYAGYLEKASNAQLEDKTANAGTANYTLFGQWYKMNGQPWCAMFVSYCAEQAGIPTGIIPKHASCAVGVSWFKQNGRWHPRAGYTPQPGDIIYFTNDGVSPAHVGIVKRADSVRVYTVEGNTSGGTTLIANGGAVAEKSYPVIYASILGYGNPDYPENCQEENSMTAEEVKREITGLKGTGGAHSVWADEAVGAFIEAGIMSGDGQGNFGWGQCLTREGAAQLLYNLLERLGLLEALKKGAGL